jgi:hypothetical protein
LMHAPMVSQPYTAAGMLNRQLAHTLQGVLCLSNAQS